MKYAANVPESYFAGLCAKIVLEFTRVLYFMFQLQICPEIRAMATVLATHDLNEILKVYMIQNIVGKGYMKHIVGKYNSGITNIRLQTSSFYIYHESLGKLVSKLF